MSDRPSGAGLAGETSRDAFLDGRLTLLQPKRGPRAAIDALFLAAAIPAEAGAGQSVLEAGAGTGLVSLALAQRIGDAQVTGIEVQGDLCRLAVESARLNGLEARVRFLEGDVTGPPERLDALALRAEAFRHTAANPPYLTEGRARSAATAAKQRAHMADDGDLDLWVRFLTRMTAPGGTVTLIHRAEELARLLACLDRRFGGLAVFPLFPHAGEPAHRVLVQGVKGSRAPLRLASGLVLHEVSGAYTAAADAVLRAGEGLALA